MDSPDSSATESTLLLFGPQILSFNAEAFENLRSFLLESYSQQWFLDTIFELPKLWDEVASAIPQLSTVPGKQYLSNLAQWLKTGVDGDFSPKLPNTTLTPLVVVTHLAQFSRKYRQGTTGDSLRTSPEDFVTPANSKTAGFCTGLLGALVVSSSLSWEDFEKYGAAAIRLAMVIGALVDAHEIAGSPSEKAKSYATAWTSLEQGAEMIRILNRFPDAYISVLYDEKRATITASAQSAGTLVQSLKAAGIVVSETTLSGRFHYQRHSSALQPVLRFCDEDARFQFPVAAKAKLPTFIASEGKPAEDKMLHHLALQSILVDQCDWYQTFSEAHASLLDSPKSSIVVFGADRFIPPSMVGKLKSPVTYASDSVADALRPTSGMSSLAAKQSVAGENSGQNDIAIIGMSIQVAGADDLSEFWDLNCRAESQHIEVPESRFTFQTMWRDQDPKRKWYGNFIRDVDAFDHKFFKRSPRESASMDPQQRLLLQAAYQAVEQSGYFALPNPDRHIGCYIGACAADYEHNVAGYAPNAFTATGNLKSFIPGKVSHYFGWTGPGMTIDTACSASAVAIHTACRAILHGECSGGALAGGVGTIGNPIWFQNLAGATFLSPTGQCKPFDELADGYCRGEGIGCVFLKKMSDAIADGNQILGSIASTSVFQNENCTPLFVPNSPSLSYLFKDVVRRANLEPKDISLVEAHGTGTPVGDPAEYESVLRALAGPDSKRTKPLPLGSVKGLIGHTEGASGVISLIKVVLAMQEGQIPAQASHSKMSHHITRSPTDMIEVPTSQRPWTETYKAALINNYGASGSNASMVITQPKYTAIQEAAAIQAPGIKHPFWIPAFDQRSIAEYCRKLHQTIKKMVASKKETATLANLSFNVARQTNRTLPNATIFSCSSLAELEDHLTTATSNTTNNPVKAARPVILCFGGQVSTFVGLDRSIYEAVKVFRFYLDLCDSTIRSLGLASIFPAIFQREPVEDTVLLQTMLFAMQYSCAMSWIDCGVEVEAVVGHSFGEITALAVSGALPVKDVIKLVAARATLVRDSWGADKGAMVAVEGDIDLVRQLVDAVNQAYTGDRAMDIACFNGPRSFTLAGSTATADILAQTVSKDSSFASLKTKRLNVSNAFHSTLVEPLVPELEKIGRGLCFQKPTIQLERATESVSGDGLNSIFVAEHMRKPVYFNHALQRIAKQHPSAVWLEAGSCSTVTIMASRALSVPGSHFQAVDLTHDGSLRLLTDATVALWREGVQTQFWPHHGSQTSDYAPLILPPYQFEKHRHWLDLKVPQPQTAAPAPIAAKEEIPTGLYSFVGYQDNKQREARFRINTFTKKYEDFVAGHMIANTAPICPATLEVDMAAEAIMSIRPDLVEGEMQPQIVDMQNHAPICCDHSRFVWLAYEAVDADTPTWRWKIFSSAAADAAKGQTVHVDGKLRFCSPNDDQYKAEFARFERMVSHKRCLSILNSDDQADDIIQGRNVYKTFGEIVDYGEMYRGVKKVVGMGSECAGRVVMKHSGETALDTLLSDCFSQVGGIWVNCMTDRDPGDMFIASGCELFTNSPVFRKGYKMPETWDVFASHHQASDKMYMTDLFVFDPTNGALLSVMIGIQYHKVSKASMSKILSRLTSPDALPEALKTKAALKTSVSTESTSAVEAITVSKSSPITTETKAAVKEGTKKRLVRPDLSGQVREIVANISGLETSDVKPDSELPDLGIDSLMSMELVRDVETAFNITLDPAELMEASNFKLFVKLITASVYGDAPADEDGEEDTSSTSQWSGSSDGASTPHTSPLTTPHGELATIPDEKLAIVGELELRRSQILGAFGESKMLTDKMIRDYKVDDFADTILSKTTQLCIALVLEAFEKLGNPLKTAKPGQKLDRISYVPQHDRLVQYLYDLLENEARLVDIKDDEIIRTAISAPKKSSESLLKDLLDHHAQWQYASKLTHFAGKHLADVLRGETDGIKVIFATPEGRELVSALYCDHSFNRLHYNQMKDFIGRLVSRLPSDGGPLKILEMGAGTGGTTQVLAPFLDTLGFPIEYTFTDLAPSMVAQARKKYKQYPFMKFAVHDIEKEPPQELRNHHIVIASNAVHATHNLTKSASCIRSALRPDGFLMMLEMTAVIPFIEIIFGLLEGWWLFDDGRRHAIASATRWERDLQSVGFGHVDYSDGSLPENEIQKVIVALASGQPQEKLPRPQKEIEAAVEVDDKASREEEISRCVKKFSQDFTTPTPSVDSALPEARCVLVTGATGSLGSHLIEQLARRSDVSKVVCLNRGSKGVAETRQKEALLSRGINLNPIEWSKLTIFETDTSKPNLGLDASQYGRMSEEVTDIIHNAWPMSGTRPVKAFDAQFQALRNLIDLAHDVVCHRPAGFRFGFEFISSIGVVGGYPIWSGKTSVPEERMAVRSVLPVGYCEAKLVCERILDATLHQYPEHFRAMSARLGQIAGSRTSGYWNPVEHFSFLIKSCQSLRALPDFDGVLSWVPVNDVAGTVVDLVMNDGEPYPIYHVDNPDGQPWGPMILTLAEAMDIPHENIIPFQEWVRRVRQSPLSIELDNPAGKLIGFLDDHFLRMSCGGLRLDTTKTREHSPTLAAQGPVSPETAVKYIASWKEMGFLHP